MKNLKNNVMEILVDMQYEGYELENVISDVLNHGCASGIVGALTYYSQTRKFFIDNMDEIFDLYNEYIQEFGGIGFDLDFNSLSWFAFEEMTRIIADEMEINW
jgi:hypothetical protein